LSRGLTVVDALPEGRANPVRILLVSRVQLYSSAIAALLGGQTDVTLVGAASPCDDIAGALDVTQADVVLLDAGNKEALGFAQRLILDRPQTRILGFGVDDSAGNVIACAQAGLWGYVPSTASLVDLIAAAKRVAHGDTVCSAAMADGIFRYVRSAYLVTPGRPEVSLTHRQQQIVQLIGEGLSNKEIARRLSLGNSTVKNHVHDILDRLQVSRRGEVAARIRHRPRMP
jgi:two-component system, NarL family, nitrate/nitrite response regulator NarL